jgi:hypothetical protein
MKKMPLENSKARVSIAPVHKRNKVALFLMLPFACVAWLFGWTLTLIGSGKRARKLTKSVKPKDSSLTLLVREQFETQEAPQNQ